MGVKEQFAWRHYYWYLTNEGIQYLRDYLHLPPEIVPSTLKRQAPRETRPRASAAPRAGGEKAEGDRAAYRRAPGAGETDKAGVQDLDLLLWNLGVALEEESLHS